MASPSEKLAESLDVLRRLQERDVVAIRSIVVYKAPIVTSRLNKKDMKWMVYFKIIIVLS